MIKTKQYINYIVVSSQMHGSPSPLWNGTPEASDEYRASTSFGWGGMKKTEPFQNISVISILELMSHTLIIF